MSNSRYERRDVLACVALAAAVGVVASWTFGDWAVLTPDGFAYLRAARSLFEAGAFPAERMTLPPGYALALMPAMAGGDAPWIAVRMLSCIGWAAASILTYVYYRPELRRGGALAAGLIVATAPAFLTQSAFVLSELLFIPLALGALVLLRRRDGGSSPRIGGVFAAGGLTGTAILVRTIGVALIPVALIVLALRGDARIGRRIGLLVVYLAAALGPQALWSVRNGQYEGGYGYREILLRDRPGEATTGGPIMRQVDRALRYGPLRLGKIKEAVAPNRLAWRLFQPPWDRPASWLIGGALLLLCAWRVVFRRSPADGFALVLFAILAVWPWDEGPRFVLPMLPVFAGAGVAALTGSYRRRTAADDNDATPAFTSGRGRRVMAAAVISVVLCMQLVEGRLIADASAERAERERGRVATMMGLVGAMNEAIPRDATLACVMPNRSYGKTLAIGAAYFARRDIAAYRDLRDGDLIDWREYGAHHVITLASLVGDSGRTSALLPARDQNGSAIALVMPETSHVTRSEK